jgi:hypothetical protein
MSYCRFTEGDVYAYACDGGVQFYVSDGKTELDSLCNTFNEAYQYAKALRDAHGLDVPSHAIEALKADALEEAARICGPDSAVSELEAQNVKLRELTKDMFNCISHANELDWFYFERDKTGCGMSCTVNGEKCGLLVLADRMCELGIEVDE